MNDELTFLEDKFCHPLVVQIQTSIILIIITRLCNEKLVKKTINLVETTFCRVLKYLITRAPKAETEGYILTVDSQINKPSPFKQQHTGCSESIVQTFLIKRE